MTALHAHFALRNQQAFQRLLDSSRAAPTPALSSSGGGRSWNKPSPLSGATPTCDVNARDWLGRTVLHLAVSSIDPAALEYVKLLLAHPRIDVNALDMESRWSPLHRALYMGNLAACILLLQKGDSDTSLKDYEGYTAFDLYNSTVEGTKPEASDPMDLFTWGTNRNAALGLGDGADRAYPEQVFIPPQMEHPAPHTQPLSKRFQPIRVLDVSMAKLHTAAVTAEPYANLRVCGFGGVVRGAAQHRLAPLKDLALVSNSDDTNIVQVALGQDHTLALTRAGSVLSWGLSRFSQLGYAVDGSGAGLGTGALQMVATPRRVVGPLKKELVIGVAACKTASACWTAKELFTWGTNSAQLGYDMAAVPVQVLPRRVAQVAQPVRNVALSDAAMAVLLTSNDVLCFAGGRSFKINFPTASFPPALTAYRPPAAQNNAAIAKVVCCENAFAALSSNGEMFTFNFPAVGSSSVIESNATQSKESKGGISAVSNAAMVKPQRVWALRKQFSAVKDVALGSDGTIVLCTESGHVYVRNRLAKTAKFQRMPFLQRVVRVAASSAGAFAALRANCVSEPIEIVGNTLSKDLEAVQPYLRWAAEELQWGCEEHGSANRLQEQTEISAESPTVIEEGTDVDGEGQGESEDVAIKNDIRIAKHLLELLDCDEKSRREEHRGIFDGVELKYGADLLVQVSSGFAFPLHRIVLAARSLVLKDVLLGQSVKDNAVSIKLSHSTLVSIHPKSGSIPKLVFSGLHPLTVLLLATYLYTDDVPALWDRRVGMAVCSQLGTLGPKTKVNPAQIRAELHVLAKLLRLPALEKVLDAPVKHVVVPTLARDMQTLFEAAQPGGDVTCPSGDAGSEIETLLTSPMNPLASDTVLELADRRVYCHATMLRARSPFFAGFFDDADWTQKRWRPDGTLHVDLQHLRWQVMEFVFRYLYSGGGEEIFEILDFTDNVDNVLDFIFEVMHVASELLLDRLLLICSSVVLKLVNVNNVCAVLSDATHFHATQLVASLQDYMARNMETLLESHMLDDLSSPLVKQLSAFVRACQAKKLPVTRSGVLVSKALENCKDWLALQDIPQPFISGRRGGAGTQIRHSPRLSPVAVGNSPGNKRTCCSSMSTNPVLSTPVSPSPSPQISGDATASGDEIFLMDDDMRGDIPPLDLRAAPRNLHVPRSGHTAPSSQIPAVGTYSPWKARVAQLPSSKLDLRAIMAETESQRETPPPSEMLPSRSRVVGFDMHATRIASTSHTSQKAPLISDTMHSKTSSPWRLPGAGSIPIPSSSTPVRSPGIARTSSDSPQNTPPSGLSRVLQDGQLSATKTTSPLTPPAPVRAGLAVFGKGKAPLGRTFTPTRQAHPVAAPMARRVSEGSGNAWVAAPAPYMSEPEPSTSVSPPSFLSIQRQQLDQDAAPTKAKSLREIQEEEQARTAAEKAQQEEADFMRWWAAEEDRIRRETQAQPGPPITVSASSGSKAGKKSREKGTRKKPPLKGAIANADVDALQTQTYIKAQGKSEGLGQTADERKPTRSRRAKGKTATNSQRQQV